MAKRRSKKQIDRIKKSRRKKIGRYTKNAAPGSIVGRRAARVARARTYGGDPALPTGSRGQDRQQPRPRVPLLTGGKDPTLGERFEEELHRR